MKENINSGTLIAGALFIGMGIGYLTGYFIPGMFLGLGTGFVLNAIIRMTNKQNKISHERDI